MLTKAERDEIRAYCESARRRSHKQHMTWAHQDKLAAMGIEALGDLDAQDAEVARLTAENDRLIAVEMQSTWESLYWTERNAVADRDATIMAERAKVAAMRLCLVRQGCACRKGNSAEGESPHKCFRCETLESNDAGKALLDAHVAELATTVTQRDFAQTELIEMQAVVEALREQDKFAGEAYAVLLADRKRLIAQHAEEQRKAAQEWLHLDAARTMLIEERDALKVEHAAELEKMRNDYARSS